MGDRGYVPGDVSCLASEIKHLKMAVKNLQIRLEGKADAKVNKPQFLDSLFGRLKRVDDHLAEAQSWSKSLRKDIEWLKEKYDISRKKET